MDRLSELCSTFGLDPEESRRIVEQNAPQHGEARVLRMEDLVLAQGCARGNTAAWDCFAARYGGRLYAIALSITREEGSAHDLAGSLYADLFGSKKLLSYSGRGSLEGWLRAVMAQEYVNRLRAGRRLVSYEESFAPAGASDPEFPDGRLGASVDAALATLKSEERFLLASYYLDARTLAQIGGILGVHESTVSRRMEKLVAVLRKRTLKELRRRGVTGRIAEEMLGADVREVKVDVGRRLMESPGARK